MNNWVVYIIQCLHSKKGYSYYTGITNQWPKRFYTHLNKKGAKYTKQHIPQYGGIIYTNLTKSEACKLETKTKKLTSKEKKDLLKKANFIVS